MCGFSSRKMMLFFPVSLISSAIVLDSWTRRSRWMWNCRVTRFFPTTTVTIGDEINLQEVSGLRKCWRDYVGCLLGKCSLFETLSLAAVGTLAWAAFMIFAGDAKLLWGFCHGCGGIVTTLSRIRWMESPWCVVDFVRYSDLKIGINEGEGAVVHCGGRKTWHALCPESQHNEKKTSDIASCGDRHYHVVPSTSDSWVRVGQNTKYSRSIVSSIHLNLTQSPRFPKCRIPSRIRQLFDVFLRRGRLKEPDQFDSVSRGKGRWEINCRKYYDIMTFPFSLPTPA